MKMKPYNGAPSEFDHWFTITELRWFLSHLESVMAIPSRVIGHRAALVLIGAPLAIIGGIALVPCIAMEFLIRKYLKRN